MSNEIDIKKNLLLFLYENRNTTPLINEELKASTKTPTEMRYFLRQLRDAGLIEVSPDYCKLGNSTNNGRGQVLSDVNNTPLHAKLTVVKGEDYVRMNYLTETPAQSIIAHNVHIGNNSGTYTQQSNSDNPATIKEKKEGFLKTTGTIVGILTGIAGATWVIIQIWHYFHPVKP